jgi:hypothetical protein
MNKENQAGEPAWARRTISLPTDLADYLEDQSAPGKASAYVADLLRADRARKQARQELREFGYVGVLEITDEGRERARQTLERHARSRAGRRGQSAA